MWKETKDGYLLNIGKQSTTITICLQDKTRPYISQIGKSRECHKTLSDAMIRCEQTLIESATEIIERVGMAKISRRARGISEPWEAEWH